MTAVRLTPDCGPHCKVKKATAWLNTIKLVHCKCMRCHGKPAPESK